MMPRERIMVSILVVVVAGLGLTQCRKDMPPPPPDQSSGNIAATVNAANQGEIQISQLAQMQAMNEDVKDFAKKMVNQHTETQQRQSALFGRLGITPTENSMSQKLQEESSALLNRLRPLTGRAFDLAYVEGAIVLHQRVISLLDNSLVPGAPTVELRADLQKMRTDVAQHLQEGQMLRAKLVGGMADMGPGDGGAGDGGTGDGGTGDGGGTTDGGTTDGGGPVDSGVTD